MTIPRDTFGWVDLASTDQEAAKKFYSELFEWEAQDGPLPDGGYYTNFTKDGKAVAGLGATMAEGMPSMWSSYVLVDSADEKTKAAKEAGGQVFMEPMDVMEFGRMAFLADPSGAAFGLWEPKTHKGAEMYGDHGSLAWNELATRDLDVFLRALRPLVADARPVVSDLRTLVRTPGGDNDLIELTAKLPRLERLTSVALPRANRFFDSSSDEVDTLRAYTPDLVSFLTKFGQVTSYYDANGHYARVQPLFSPFAYDADTGELSRLPDGQRLDRFELDTSRRCPGAATQRTPDGSGPLPTPGCDPSISLPGD